ncbi:hypothetical protein HQ529_00015 [Candidatus Woesearchaeota archaeon]|nr:hypothetical protein [Candidatus Woesearchaeota archaeon]
MNSLKAVITDVEGNYRGLESKLYQLPSVAGGIGLFGAGDLNGPFNKDFLRSKRAKTPEKYYQNLYDSPLKGEDGKEQALDFGTRAYDETTGIIDLLTNNPKINVEALISGNGEEDYQKFIPYFSNLKSPRDMFDSSDLNFIEMPDVYFYKDGKRVEGDEDVDAAVLLLPYIQPYQDYNIIQKIFGQKSSDKNYMRKALQMLFEDNGIIDKIKKANPKYIFQIQHELPDKEIFRPYGTPHDAKNKEIYEAVMEEISKYIEGTGKNYTIIFGHMEKGGRFRKTINYKGKDIKTIHVGEKGSDILLFDVKTGKIYEKGEEVEISDDEELSEKTIEDVLEECEEECMEEAESE